MGQVLQFFRREKAFDCETTAALGAAYEKAINGMENRGQPHTMREVVARRILALAAKGERDPDRLSAAALATVARTFTSREPAVRTLVPSAQTQSGSGLT